MTSEMEPLFDPRYDAIVDLTDPTPPSIDISMTPHLIVDLTTSQWIVDLTTTNDGDDEAKFADELACKFL